jgi:plastocyanin
MTKIAIGALLLVVGCAQQAEQDEQAAQGADTGAASSAAPSTAESPGNGTQVMATLTEWAVQLSRPEVQRGMVTFSIENKGTMTHEFEVEGKGNEWKSSAIPAGQRVLMSMVLEPGEYEVYCPISDSAGNHKEKGMTARLVVR